MNNDLNVLNIKKEDNMVIIKDINSKIFIFNIEKNIKSKIYLLLNIKEESKIDLNIGDNSNIEIILISTGIKSFDLNINLEPYSSLKLYSSDLYDADSNNNKFINLKDGSSFKGYEFLSARGFNISGVFHINHNESNTTSKSDFYYLSNKGEINRELSSIIKKGIKDSEAIENVKGILTSNDSKIDAKPVLIVDSLDVKASHGCAIGTIDENEIYYLMSRGLTREDAQRIISYSLIAPILREIDNLEFRELVEPKLLSAIGGV